MGKFAEAQPPEGFVRWCKVTLLQQRVDDEDRKAIRGYLANRDLSDKKISEWLNGLGEDIGETTLNSHRTGKCCNGAGKVR